MEMLPFGLSTLTKGTLRKNATTLEFFADAAAGDDANDGRSWATAKQTIQAAYNLIPYVVSGQYDSTNHVVLHLKGTFTLTDEVYIENFVDGLGYFIITGTDDVAIVDDNGGSNYTASGSTTSSLTISSPLWTTDQHVGYMVEILSGAAAGQRRTVQKNTTTVITPTINFGVSPGIGCTFRIVKPATIINSSIGDYQSFYVNTLGSGYVILQKLTIEEDVVLGFYGTGSLQFSNCVCAVSLSAVGPSPDFGSLRFTTQCFNVTSPFSTDTFKKCGVGWVDLTKGVYVTRSKPLIAGSILPVTTLSLCLFSSGSVGNGSRVEQLEIIEGRTDSITNANIRNSSGSPILILSTGIKMANSNLNLGALTIANVTGNAIECEDTRLRFVGIVGGTGNTKAGLYAWGRSYITFATGSVPTVTGTVGDVSVDNATQKSTWAAINGGTPVNDTTEMVVVKKV